MRSSGPLGTRDAMTGQNGDGDRYVEPASDRSPAAYEPGDNINRRYEVLAILGSGLFSSVYKVHDSLRDEVCALKIYGPNFGLDVAQRELRALMTLHHPNIVKVIDIGRTLTRPRQWFLKAEYVPGSPLSDFTRADGEKLPIETALDIADQLLDALQVIHPDSERIDELKNMDELTGAQYDELQQLQEQGLVHRDIKPENMILTTNLRLKLLDFNIAIPAGAAVLTQSGTPSYQPPEANFATWDVSPDLFATGVLLFELLTHVHPYPDAKPALDITPLDPGDLNVDLTPDLAATVRRMCMPLTSDRYVSAQAMREALYSSAQADAARPTESRESFLAQSGDALVEWLLDARPRVEVTDPSEQVWLLKGVPKGWAVSIDGSGGIIEISVEADSNDELKELREMEETLDAEPAPVRTPTGVKWLIGVSSLGCDEVLERVGLAVVRAYLITVDLAEGAPKESRVPSLAIGHLPDGHHHVGWIDGADVRIPLVLSIAEPSEGEVDSVVLSAATASGTRRYDAARGAYLWDDRGNALKYESAVTARWELTSSPDRPVGAAVESGTFALTWPEGALSPMLARSLTVTIENRDGSAFVSADTDASSEETDASSKPIAGTAEMTIHRFLQMRRGAPNTAKAVSAFADALDESGIDWEFGRSEGSADGYGGYAIAKASWAADSPQIAYLWPSTGQLDIRLPAEWARGRKHAGMPRSRKANGFDVQLEVRSLAALDEALDLMNIAIRGIES